MTKRHSSKSPFAERREQVPSFSQSLRIVGVYFATKLLGVRDVAALVPRFVLLRLYLGSVGRAAVHSPYDERGFERALNARRAGVPKRALTYGETPVFSAMRFLRAAGVGAGTSLLDLGCGRGRVLLAAKRLGATRVAGIDLLAAHTDGPADRFARADIELARGDWFKASCDGFSHVFVAWTCASASARRRLIRDVFRQCSPGTKIITLSVPISADGFRSQRLGRFWFSWGPAPVFCATRLDDDATA